MIDHASSHFYDIIISDETHRHLLGMEQKRVLLQFIFGMLYHCTWVRRFVSFRFVSLIQPFTIQTYIRYNLAALHY